MGPIFLLAPASRDLRRASKIAIRGDAATFFLNFSSNRVASYSFGARTACFLQKMDSPSRGVTIKLYNTHTFLEFATALVEIGFGKLFKVFSEYYKVRPI